MAGIHNYAHTHTDTTRLWLLLALNFLIDGIVIILGVIGG